MGRYSWLVAGVALAAGTAFAAKVKSLDEYLDRYFTWALGGNAVDHQGTVDFMPIPAGGAPDADGVSHGETSVTMKANESFFLPIFVFYGERYDNGTPDDDPADHSIVPSPADFKSSVVHVELDGAPIITPSTDLSDYFVGAEYFNKPIVYAQPTGYGSVSALWIEGLAFTHEPMTKGTHTLHLRITNDYLVSHYGGFAGYENVWHITVK
jgi:hypothetical protein